MIELNDFSKKTLTDTLKSIIIENENGFAGFRELRYLVDYLWAKNFTAGFDKEDLKTTLAFLGENKLEFQVKKFLEKATTLLPSNKPINIFIFPLIKNKDNEFCFAKLNGVDANTNWQNTILLSIGKTESWQSALEESVMHEYCHAITMNFSNPWVMEKFTLADYLIFEGLADNFVKAVLNRQPIWLKKLPKTKELALLEKLRDNFASTDINFNRKVMFGEGKDFPVWGGYWLGFKMVQSFLANNPQMSFREIVQLPLHDIFKRSST
jgi:uncharacterized protein YjaZ